MTEENKTPPQTQLAKKGQKQTLKELLEGEGFKLEVRKAMANAGGSPEAFIRAALTAAVRNPTLYKVSPDSLWQCLFDLAQMGLYPDGRRAHLVPFWDNQKSETLCQLIIDYKGIAELARKNGDVVYIHCDVVHEGEHFLCSYGTDGRLEHVPDAECEDNPIKCAYSHVKFLIPGTTMLVEEYTQMSLKAIEKIHQRSKSKDKGPWKTDFEEMAKKTVFRRHSKTLALSPETRHAVEYGDDQDFTPPSSGFRSAIPAIIPKREDYTEPEEDKPAPAAQEPPRRRRRASAAVATPEPAPMPVQNEPEDSLPFGNTPGTEPAKTDAQVLENLIKGAGIDRHEFFEYLSACGLDHVKDPALKILTFVDMKPDDIKDTIANWEANLADFKSWMKEPDAA